MFTYRVKNESESSSFLFHHWDIYEPFNIVYQSSVTYVSCEGHDVLDTEYNSTTADCVEISTHITRQDSCTCRILPVAETEAPIVWRVETSMIVIVSGTLRTNLDPFGLHDDSQLWDTLKRSHLLNTIGREPLKEEEPSTNRFTLDTVIEEGGANLSIGQRSLVSLARALVKDFKIIILDEATGYVKRQNSKIQETIAREFQDRTVLCIAHRLRTIISYDRICVLDAGQVAEFDTPERLYMQPNGIFKGMCQQSSITFDDIKQFRQA